MGQCVSRKAGAAIAASEHRGSPSYRIMDKPTKKQADSQVYVDEIIQKNINPEYFDPSKTHAVVVDDSEGGNKINMNVTVVKKLPPETYVHFSLTGLSMGEYKLSTGFDFEMTLCEVLAEPIVVGPFLSELGFSADVCPPEPGVYSKSGYKISMDTLPDDFVENKYLASLVIRSTDTIFLTTDAYADILDE